jgi:hypothetical protein
MILKMIVKSAIDADYGEAIAISDYWNEYLPSD